MRLSIFENLMKKYPKEAELDKMVSIMQTSSRLHKLCDQRQKYLSSNRKAEADNIKKGHIPAFAPAAFLFDGKSRINVLGLTGICFLETDHISEEKIRDAMQLLEGDSHILLALRSISGDGLHFFVKYSLDGMKLPNYSTMGIDRMNHTYCAVFESLKNRYGEILDVSIDKSGANMERLCLISYDPNLYYNPYAVPYFLEYKKQKIKRKPNTLKIVE